MRQLTRCTTYLNSVVVQEFDFLLLVKVCLTGQRLDLVVYSPFQHSTHHSDANLTFKWLQHYSQVNNEDLKRVNRG